MSVDIFVDPNAAGGEVIRAFGRCYRRVGASDTLPDTYEEDIEGVFEECEECESSSGSSSGSSASGSVSPPPEYCDKWLCYYDCDTESFSEPTLVGEDVPCDTFGNWPIYGDWTIDPESSAPVCAYGILLAAGSPSPSAPASHDGCYCDESSSSSSSDDRSTCCAVEYCCFSSSSKLNLDKPTLSYSGSDPNAIAAIAWYANQDTSSIDHVDPDNYGCGSWEYSKTETIEGRTFSLSAVITFSSWGWYRTIYLMVGWNTVAYIDGSTWSNGCCNADGWSDWIYSDYYDEETWESAVVITSSGSGVTVSNNKCDRTVCGDCKCIDEDACAEGYTSPNTCESECLAEGVEYTIDKITGKGPVFQVTVGKRYCLEWISGAWAVPGAYFVDGQPRWKTSFYLAAAGTNVGVGHVGCNFESPSINSEGLASSYTEESPCRRSCADYSVGWGTPGDTFDVEFVRFQGFSGTPIEGDEPWKIRICELKTDFCEDNPLP